MPKKPRSQILKLILRLLKYWEVWVILIVLTAGLAIAAYPQISKFYQVQDEKKRFTEASELQQQQLLLSETSPLHNGGTSQASLSQSPEFNNSSQSSCASNQKLSILTQVIRKPEIEALAAPTNRGEREAVDRTPQKQKVLNIPLVIVLHETVIPLDETLKLFQTSTNNDSAQLSYHVLIGLNGDRYRVVPDNERAFGAGNSDFEIVGQNGRRQSIAVALNPNLPSSINNVALHVSLETPADGNREVPSHSGYTEEQYAALAKVVGDWMSQYNLDSSRITTHKAVDRDQRKQDPRSFDDNRFAAYLNSYRQLGSCLPS